MKRKLIFIVSILTVVNVLLVVSAFASPGELRGKHLENGIECVDCHGTDNPTKKAKTSACRSCHDDGPDIHLERTVGDTVYKIPIHNAHPGKIRCALCHQIHEPSKLYCNKCHPFEIKVP